mmetsp:Transcript_81065/g.206060  ORF Transcript_81065/g.206060 Transcript_81065/m.206060 type:complete len:284 (-) Transcript_81065:2214-3065(-)
MRPIQVGQSEQDRRNNGKGWAPWLRHHRHHKTSLAYGRSPLGLLFRREVDDVPVPTCHVRVLLGVDGTLGQLRQLSGISCGRSTSAFEIASRAQMVIQSPQVLDERHTASVRLPLPCSASACTSATTRSARIDDHGFRRLCIRHKICMPCFGLLGEEDIHIHAEFVLQVIHVLHQQCQLIEGCLGAQSRCTVLRSLVARECCEGAQELTERFERRVLHESHHHVSPLCLRFCVALHLLRRDERQLFLVVHFAQFGENCNLPIRVSQGNVNSRRCRLGALGSLL